MENDEKKKVLVIMGMDQKLEHYMNQLPAVSREHILVIQCYGPVISHPYDDVMRAIILAVYEEHVEEIYVASANVNRKHINNLVAKIYEDKALQKKIKSIDYLFKYDNLKMTGGSVKEWLEGLGTHDSAAMIQQHPLLPPQVKVTQLRNDWMGEKLA